MPDEKQSDIDPLVTSSLREAILVVLIWIVAATWSLTVSYQMGYQREPGDLNLIFGFPDWVFWGVVVPWLVFGALSWWFGSYFVRDGELGEDLDDIDELGLGG